jgi:putative ubiquitin-RnfH superfamily antitoxin RatB of RatAB toxin-antitoxin module
MADVFESPLKVVVAYAAPGVEAQIELALPAGSVVADAVDASGFIARLALDRAMIGYAIFGERARADTPLRDGDRVELTRPLLADPKDARRRRARTPPPARKRRRRPTGSEA